MAPVLVLRTSARSLVTLSISCPSSSFPPAGTIKYGFGCTRTRRLFTPEAGRSRTPKQMMRRCKLRVCRGSNRCIATVEHIAVPFSFCILQHCTYACINALNFVRTQHQFSIIECILRGPIKVTFYEIRPSKCVPRFTPTAKKGPQLQTLHSPAHKHKCKPNGTTPDPYLCGGGPMQSMSHQPV